jgi:hypothetical protein
MHLRHLILPAALSMALSVPALAAEDASHFLLTPALMQKMKAAEPDLKKLKGSEDRDDEQSAESIEDFMKAIDRHPGARAVLARHGLSSRELAFATHAMLHAGMYVAMEKLMDKKKGDALFASYTKEQKANIAFMRSMAPAAHATK